MNSSSQTPRFRPRSHKLGDRAALTLVEILVAMTVTIMLILGMAQAFAMIGTGMENRRSILQMSGQMRGLVAQLEDELQGVTVPLRVWSGENQGYFEYVEGIGTDTQPIASAVPFEAVSSLFGDFDDTLAFTTRRVGAPYLGQHLTPGADGGWGVQGVDDDGNGITDFDPATGIGDLNEAGWPGSDDSLGTFESELAEVIYSVVYIDNDPVLDAVDAGASPPISKPDPGQGELTLHRKACLIRPDLANANQLLGRFSLAGTSTAQLQTTLLHLRRYLAKSDLSMRLRNVTIGGNNFIYVFANTLSDLAQRENRYSHFPVIVRDAANDLYWTGLPAYSGLTGFPHQMSLDPLYQNNNLWSATSINQRFTFPRRDSTDPIEQLHYNHYGDEAGETVALSQILSFNIKAFDSLAQLRTSPGPDGAWGAAGFDDNQNGVNDDVLEAGWTSIVDPDFVPDDSEGMTVEDPLIQQWLGLNPAATPAMLNAQFPVVGSGAFVDLGYARHVPLSIQPALGIGAGARPSQFSTFPVAMPATYDTWTDHYERDGIDQNNGPIVNLGANGLDDDDDNAIDEPDEQVFRLIDEGLNGLDDDGVNGVDDPGERETAPPYAWPLRGLQIQVRVYDPKTRQVRQGTVSVDFIPE